MRKLIFFAALFCMIIIQSCDLIPTETIHGNGTMSTENRSISGASKIESRGSFDVEIIKGSSPSIKIEADANLIPYIITRVEEGKLVIKSKDGVGLNSDNKIKVTVTTSQLEEVEVAGSGNVTSSDKFEGGDHLTLDIAGSGDMKLNVNTPKVESTISGSGSITLSGETKDSQIDINGNGDYKAEDLQAESVRVEINGSGSARVAASTKLDIHIAGSGDIFYKGSPVITQSIAGSGNIKQL